MAHVGEHAEFALEAKQLVSPHATQQFQRHDLAALSVSAQQNPSEATRAEFFEHFEPTEHDLGREGTCGFSLTERFNNH